MSSNYTPREPKTKISVTVDLSVEKWIKDNLPKGARSDFLNALARDYITRERELVKRGKVEKVKA